MKFQAGKVMDFVMMKTTILSVPMMVETVVGLMLTQHIAQTVNALNLQMVVRFQDGKVMVIVMMETTTLVVIMMMVIAVDPMLTLLFAMYVNVLTLRLQLRKL